MPTQELDAIEFNEEDLLFIRDSLRMI